MKTRSITLLLTLVSLPAAPAFAQTVVGGGACTSTTLTGPYEVLLSGRQLTSTGATTQLFQAVGTATFDGLSKVTFALTANTITTVQTFGTQTTLSGSYSLQSNCVGAITITSGGTATFTLEAYTQSPSSTSATSFALVGSDATYSYNGTGNDQPATCPTTISGAHEFSGNGSGLTGATVTSTVDVAGILQFNTGNISANWTQVSNATTTQVTATGTYSVGANCLASATLIDTANNKYTFSMSFDSASPAFSLAASSPTVLFDGSGAAMQPSTVTSCSTSMLNGTYYMTLSGHVAQAGVANKVLTSDGSATFNGSGKVTFSLTANTVNGSQVFNAPLTYSGTYALASSCQGSISITTGDTASFSIVAYNFDATTLLPKTFAIVGADAVFAYTGGLNIQPAACAVSTLSGDWPFSGTGNSLSGDNITGLADLAGIFQFDGQGNVTASWTDVSNAASTNVSATGTYTVTGACLGTISLTDTSNATYTGALSVFGVDAYGYPNNFELTLATPQLIFSGAGREAFYNPGEAVVNNADSAPSTTPAGSDFSIYGSSLATKISQPTTTTLPTTVLNTTVTVNGEAAPLFYVSPGQIDAQMPWDIVPGLATLVVKNGASSNAVSVIVPSVSPQIIVYGNNLAVATDTNYNVFTSASPALAGNTVVLWFLGGGPVNASGKLSTGAESPSGLSPVTGPYTITVDGIQATTIYYVGLTPGSVGLYQANFVMPTVPAGSHAVVLTISGQASNGPLMPAK